MLRHFIHNHFDIVLLVVAFSLVQVHLILSILALIPTIIFNTVQLINYLKSKFKKDEN